MNVNVSGPKVIFTIPVFGGINVTETVTNMWIVTLILIALTLWLGMGLKKHNPSKKQLIAEKLVSMVYNMIENTMGKGYIQFAPYIGALFSLSIVGSLSSLTGARAYTGDFNTTIAWALVTFFMVQINNVRCNGVKGWLKGFIEPVPFLLPLNIISEAATPVSIAFRHFGNIAAGMVITSLIYGALAGLSSLLLGGLSAYVGSIPFMQVGIPAVLSIYFDLFTSFLQAYIICMLTMVFITNAGSEEAARGNIK